MSLLLPPRVEQELLAEKHVAERARRRALVERLLDFQDPVCREWAPVLRRLDPLLRMGRARGQAYEPGMNVRPGFYHWVRDNVSAAVTVEPITGPDGVSFVEPDSGLLAMLERNDLQNPVVYREIVERRERAEREVELQRERDLAEVNEEALERWNAASRAQVSMSDTPWSQNSAGRRGRSK